MRLQDVPMTEVKKDSMAVGMQKDSMAIQEIGEITRQLDQLDKYLYRLSDEINELEDSLGVVLRPPYPEPAGEAEDVADIQSAMGSRLYGAVNVVEAQVKRIQELRQRVML